MKSRKKNLPVIERTTNEVAAPRYRNSEEVSPVEDTDTMGALLRRMANKRNYEFPDFAYQEDVEEDHHIDERDLYRVLEDLQFGHDQRL